MYRENEDSKLRTGVLNTQRKAILVTLPSVDLFRPEMIPISLSVDPEMIPDLAERRGRQNETKLLFACFVVFWSFTKNICLKKGEVW